MSRSLFVLLGCTFMLYPTFFHFTCFFRELPVYEQVLFTSGSSALYTGVGILLSAISPVRYPRILYTPLAMLSSSVMISLFICLFFLNEECNRFKLFSTVLSVMYLLQFVAVAFPYSRKRKERKTMHITDSLIKSAYSFTVCKKAEKPISTQSATKKQ